jgi:hypothetical protein
MVGCAVGLGVSAATTRVRIARVVITGNVNALAFGGGFVDTGGNNNIMGNGTNQSPNGTPFPEN